MLELATTGKTDKEIADEMGWDWPNSWRSVQRIRHKNNVIKTDSPSPELNIWYNQSLDELSRGDRFIYLKTILEKTPRFKFVFDSFTKVEKEIFIDEYLKIVKSTDSMTESEEQALFSACLAFIMASRALKLDRLEQTLYEETLDGKHKDGDIKFRRDYDDKFKKQYESHMKTWQDLMRGLKATREQRLKDLKSDRRSILDLATELNNKNSQAQAMNEIRLLNKKTDEELKRLIKDGYLMTVFDIKEEILEGEEK